MAEPYVGEIRMFAGNFAPSGWALCDGQLLAVSSNDALFSLFGTLYGGDGRTTFGLPDLRGRVPIHAGSGPGLTPRPLAQRGGEEVVSLLAGQVDAHTHALQGSANLGADTAPTANVHATGSGANLYKDSASATLVSLDGDAVSSTGAGQPHNNVQPFLCINFIVALFGIYPSRT